MNPPGHEWIGQTIDVWKIEARIGVGGRGEVYRAQRTGDHIAQTVAIKILKQGVPASEAENEAERLEQLGDTAIVPRLYRFGVTAGGRHYLVMEYIEGWPILRHANEQGLDLMGRLELFHRVCEAMREVFRRGVLHLDLKPQNVLVSEADGRIRLIDFGQARRERKGPQLARASDPLSLEYASPEQVTGGVLTAAADVYSLGCLFYELLTGRTPLQLGRLAPEERAEALAHRTPPPASEAAREQSIQDPKVATMRRSNPERLRSALQVGFDAVLAGALAKERRYASVIELGEEVKRLREGKSPLRKADGLGYQAVQLSRGRPVWFATAGVVLVSLYAEQVVYAMQKLFATPSQRAEEAFAPALREAAGYWKQAVPAGAVNAEAERHYGELRKLVSEVERLKVKEGAAR